MFQKNHEILYQLNKLSKIVLKVMSEKKITTHPGIQTHPNQIIIVIKYLEI